MSRHDSDEIHEALRRAWDDANPSDRDLARLDARVLGRLAELDPHTLDPHESNVIAFPPEVAHRTRTRSEMRLVQRPRSARRWLWASVAASVTLVLVTVAITRPRPHHANPSPVSARPATASPPVSSFRSAASASTCAASRGAAWSATRPSPCTRR